MTICLFYTGSDWNLIGFEDATLVMGIFNYVHQLKYLKGLFGEVSGRLCIFNNENFYEYGESLFPFLLHNNKIEMFKYTN